MVMAGGSLYKLDRVVTGRCGESEVEFGIMILVICFTSLVDVRWHGIRSALSGKKRLRCASYVANMSSDIHGFACLNVDQIPGNETAAPVC